MIIDAIIYLKMILEMYFQKYDVNFVVSFWILQRQQSQLFDIGSVNFSLIIKGLKFWISRKLEKHYKKSF